MKLNKKKKTFSIWPNGTVYTVRSKCVARQKAYRRMAASADTCTATALVQREHNLREISLLSNPENRQQSNAKALQLHGSVEYVVRLLLTAHRELLFSFFREIDGNDSCLHTSIRLLSRRWQVISAQSCTARAGG